jgi:hypothetical protein
MSNRPDCYKNHASQSVILPGGQVEFMFFWSAMAYFAAKALFFALKIRERIFPDEASWLGMAQVFSRANLLPVDSPESYPFGLVTHIPNLYFLLMGKALTLNVFPVSDLIFLRLVNVGIGLLTIFFAWRLICLLTDLLSVRLLFLIMLTNTLMFTFLFSAVSYDNLVNLLSVMSFYFTCKFSQSRQVMSLLFAIMSVLAGCLTKISFLPLALLLAIAVLCQERGNLINVFKYFKAISSSKTSIKQLIAWLTIVIMAGAGLKLYGGNWLQYSQLSPSSDSVIGLENSLKHRIYTRNYAVGNYKSGNLSWLDAQRLALQIREESDRQDTLNLLAIAREEKLHPAASKPAMGRLHYAVVWLGKVAPRIFGIMAHKNMLKEGRAEMAPYLSLLVLALLGFLLRLRAGVAGLMNCSLQLFFVTFGYLLILMQLVNYKIYKSAGVLVLALQGRYTFPVLIPFYILCAYYFVTVWSPKLRLWPTTILGILFVLGEFPWFLQHVTTDWFF